MPGWTRSQILPAFHRRDPTRTQREILKYQVRRLQFEFGGTDPSQPSEICVTSILTSPGHSRSKSMAPFGRESPTSYSTLMVTMALSASVSKLQPSEICVTSILTSPGHSRSKPMAPFERSSMTSYSTLMATMALSASVSK